jgi:hypothetical protein
MICNAHPILFGRTKHEESHGQDMLHVWGEGEVQAGFWFGDLMERDHLEDAGVDGSIIFQWLFKKWDDDMDTNDLVHDRDRWRTLVKVVMNIRFP